MLFIASVEVRSTVLIITHQIKQRHKTNLMHNNVTITSLSGGNISKSSIHVQGLFMHYTDMHNLTQQRQKPT
jgi:hypothetical protein